MESADAVSIRWKKSRISMSDIIKNGHNEIKNKYYLGRIKRDLTNFFKWMALAILTGVVVGGASSVFAICIRWVTAFMGEKIQGLRTRIGPQYVMPLLAQNFLQHIADGDIVIDNRDCLHVLPPFQASAARPTIWYNQTCT